MGSGEKSLKSLFYGALSLSFFPLSPCERPSQCRKAVIRPKGVK